jgi:hypothetical protein
MGKLHYTRVATVTSAQAILIESYLEAEGIDVELFQESWERTTFGALSSSAVEIFVPKEMVNQARKLLKAFESEPKTPEENDGYWITLDYKSGQSNE